MNVRVFRDPAQASDAAADVIANRISEHPDTVLGLPTGRTPIPIYEALCRRYADRRLDFSRVRTFNVDEFVGVPPEHRSSYRTFMQRHFFNAVNVPSAHIHFLNGTADDLQAECVHFEDRLAAVGGMDLLILGIGANGHIGFNEPGAAQLARTHRARLAPATRRANAPLFGGRVDRVPKYGLTMGVGTILRARTILLVATGRPKARPVRAMLNGPVTPSLPASFLQLHPNVEAILDRDAHP